MLRAIGVGMILVSLGCGKDVSLAWAVRMQLSGPDELTLNSCSPVTIRFLNSHGDFVAANLDIDILMNPATESGFFAADSACTQSLDTLKINKGEKDRTVYYQQSTAAPGTIEAVDRANYITTGTLLIHVKP